jgi:WD40 repeat protein
MMKEFRDLPTPPQLTSIWRRPFFIDNMFPALAYAPDGRRVAVALDRATDGSFLLILDSGSGAILAQCDRTSLPGSLAFSTDGRLLAASENNPGPAGRSLQQLDIFDSTSLRERFQYTASGGGVIRHLSFGSGQQVIAQFDSLGLAELSAIETETAELQWRLQLTGAISQFALAPDARSIALGCNDGLLIVDAATGARRLHVPSSTAVWRVAFTPDGRGVVAGGEDGSIRILESQSGIERWSNRVVSECESCVVSVSVSSDSQWVACHVAVPGPKKDQHHGALGVFGVEDGAERFKPKQTTGYGTVKYSPSRRHIAFNSAVGSPDVASSSAGLTVVDAATGAQIAVIPSRVGAFSFDAFGLSIVAVGPASVDCFRLPTAERDFVLRD